MWWFLQASSYRDPSSYTPLRQFIHDTFSIPGLNQWQGSWEGAGPKNKLPAIGINATGDDVQYVGITWPAGAIRVHPLGGRPVVVGWRSPIDAPVLVEVAVADVDPTCGDGVRWSVNLGSRVLRSGAIPDGQEDLVQVPAAPRRGDFLYLVVDVGPSGIFDCDSTSLGVSISPGSIEMETFG